MCLFFKVFWGVILGLNANYEKCDFFVLDKKSS